MSISDNLQVTVRVDMLEFDLADRLRRSMRVAGVSSADMAEYLGVSRNSVSAWINGRIIPNRQTVRLWALRTGAPYEWLETGIAPKPRGGGDDPRGIVSIFGGASWGDRTPDLRFTGSEVEHADEHAAVAA